MEKNQLSLFESQNVEYKLVSGDKLPDDLWQTISAFSNAEGGTVYLGIDDDGKLLGVKEEHIDVLQNSVNSLLKSAFNVPITPEINVIETNVISIYIPPAQAVNRPIYSIKRGQINGSRVRSGASNIKVNDDILRRFSVAAIGGAESITYEVDYRLYLSQQYIDAYLESVKKLRGKVYKNFTTEIILEKLRAVKDQKPSLFGLLAFSASHGLQELTAPTLNIAITQYTGKDKVTSGQIDEVSIDDKEFNGNVVNQFENAFAFLTSKLPTRSKVVAGKRIDYLAIPEEAIREALANALVHRDYSTYSSRVQVNIFSDRIEFINPGESLVPIAELDSAPSQSRNPLLMNYLKDLHITESRSRGIKTIKVSLRDAGLLEPKFENIGNSFKLTIYNSAFIGDEDQSWLSKFKIFSLNDRQMQCLTYLKNNPRKGINNSEYRELNNMDKVKDDVKAKKDLQKLVSLNLISKQGSKKGTRYYINDKE